MQPDATHWVGTRESKLWRLGWYVTFALLPFGITSLGLLLILAGMVVSKGWPKSISLTVTKGVPGMVVWSNRLFGLFLGWVVLCGVFSPKPQVALPLTFGFILLIWVFAFGGRNLGLRPDSLNRLFPILTVAGVLAAALMLARVLLFGLPRAASPITGPNGTGTLLILVTGVCVGYLLTRRTPPLALALFVFIMSAALLATKSRGAWLGFFTMFGISALTSRRNTTVILVLALLFGAAFLAIPDLGDRLSSAFQIERNMSRVRILQSTMLMIRDHPIMGLGAGVYQHVFDKYKMPGWTTGPAAYAHNLFLQVTAEFGLVGLVIFTALLGSLLLMSWRLARLGDPLYTWMFAALIGTLVHQQVDIPIWAMDVGGAFWAVIGITTGLYQHEWNVGRIGGERNQGFPAVRQE